MSKSTKQVATTALKLRGRASLESAKGGSANEEGTGRWEEGWFGPLVGIKPQPERETSAHKNILQRLGFPI